MTPVYQQTPRCGHANCHRVLGPLILLVTAISTAFAEDLAAAEPDQTSRPNIVWVMAEDCSVDYFRHYRSGGAATPNIESLAAGGVTFDNAYSCAPVCSVARTSLLTGCYAPRLMTQFHRATRKARLPDDFKVFPTRLREAGYYTTNRSKEDYNCIVTDKIWDESSRNASWQKRPTATTPFFHVETFTTSHESSLHFDRKLMNESPLDSSPVVVPPYLPDTPLTRYTKTHYLKQIEAIDVQVGRLIDQLRTAGVLDQTIIFFFGDHGGVLPRSKGYLYDSGLHVPLVVRFPDAFKKLSPIAISSRVGGTVEFVDFANTVLRLAGLNEEPQYDGRAFLGDGLQAAAIEQRDTSFGYADRFDEKCEMVRSLKVGKWKYIRSFEPFSPDGLHNDYRYKMLAYQQWRAQFTAGELNPVQRAFFEPKPAERLFDLENDPHEVHDLADVAAHRETLLRMRQQLTERLKTLPDLSMYPECYLTEHAASNPIEFAQSHRDQIAQLLAVADLGLEPFANESSLLDALASEDVWIRYRAAIVCAARPKLSDSIIHRLTQLTDDSEPVVAVRAAQALVLGGQPLPMSAIQHAVSKTKNEAALLEILNCLTQIHEQTRNPVTLDLGSIRSEFAIKPTAEMRQRLDYLEGKP